MASYDQFVLDTDEPSGYDFTAKDETGERYICVKSTEGSFDNPIHISYNELLQMREATNYDLYRVYEVVDLRARLRIVHNMKGFAEKALTVLEQLPNGVRPDSISVSPGVLDFESPLSLELPDDEE